MGANSREGGLLYTISFDMGAYSRGGPNQRKGAKSRIYGIEMY